MNGAAKASLEWDSCRIPAVLAGAYEGVMKIYESSLVVLLVVSLFIPVAAAKEKLNAEALIARHLQSLGSVERLAAIKSRLIEGRSAMRVEVGGVGNALGRVVIASEGARYRVSLPFQYTDYWGEQLLFDGNGAQIGFSDIQKRSLLGDFLYRNDVILQEGLFGGVLSTAWPLSNSDKRHSRLEYVGQKKIYGRQLHQVSYHCRKGQGDMSIVLYFESETFRHVATVYSLFIQSEASTNLAVEASGEQGSRYKLEERFEGFKTFEGVTLPTRWNIIMETSGAKGQGHRDYRFGGTDSSSSGRTFQREWAIIVDKVTENQSIDPKIWELVPERDPRTSPQSPR
ncbi:MAG TPA: hypothetical protein VE398_19750 [Acidobacteriota bacterium]|nr:hypothetical protein [Acidobacteriota bacterium]